MEQVRDHECGLECHHIRLTIMSCHAISGAGLLPAHLEEAFAECCALRRLGQRGHTPGFEPLLGNVTAHELSCGADRPGQGVLSASSPAKLGVWVN